ncbi:hypothetical protein BDV06DRAFT_221204 [Aspergillus oleicola]
MTSVAPLPKPLQNRASGIAMNLRLPRAQAKPIHERPASTDSAATARRRSDKTASALGRFTQSLDEKSRKPISKPLDVAEEATHDAKFKGGGSRGFDLDLSERLPVSLSSLTGLVVGKKGRILNREGHNIGNVVEGNPEDLVGEIVGEDGEILDEDGDVIGGVDIIHPGVPKDDKSTVPPKETSHEIHDHEGASRDQVPHISSLEGFTCNRTGEIVSPDGAAVGELFEGNPKTISSEGFQLDNQGSFLDNRGVTVGKARPTPLRDDDNNPFADQDLLLAEHSWVQQRHRPGTSNADMVEGFPGVCDLEGMKVDKHGNVVDHNGVVFGRVVVFEGRPADKPADNQVPDEDEENLEKHTPLDLAGIVVNDKGYVVDQGELAEQMCAIVRQFQSTVESLCSRISLCLGEAKGTPKNQLDEKVVVQYVKPLIEEAGNTMQDCNGALSALGPDNNMAAALVAGTLQMGLSPEYELAVLLKELAEVVIDTITNGRQLVANMRLVRKNINPQWPLLSDPLFHIIGTVGLLLNGISGLFARIVDSVWLGKVLRGLLTARGINQQLLHKVGLERILRALVSCEPWVEKLLTSMKIWGIMKGLVDMFGLDRLLETFRLGTVSEALELQQGKQAVT